ncbi:MAG: DUF4910 domain-containing protein [Treponema sp.]|nr:DUF4910 domain-containing protein [Treponema sp.]
MKNYIRAIKHAADGNRIFNNAGEVSNYHRIQSSKGFRAAAGLIAEQLQNYGLDSKVKSYPADGKKWYLSAKIFKEWDCKEAYCDLLSPEIKRLADFSANNLSIIQRSYPCDHRNKPLDVVLLDRGTEEAAYEGLDLQGKIIFVREAFQPFMEWAVKKRGAVGIISDFLRPIDDVRDRFTMFDALNYTSFWWKYTINEPKAFGFVLSPKEGDILAEQCRKMREEHIKDSSKDLYPKVSCYVSSSIYDGSFENVDTVIKGESDEEIIIVAHLCHPRASANDNASGVAAGMEAMKTLNDLLKNGKIPPLKRTIRLLLVPEFTGTYAFLDEIGAGMKKILAGINLDMVGGRQANGYGPLTMVDLPRAMPSFVTDLAAFVIDEVRKDGNTALFEGEQNISVLNIQETIYGGGSDHFILSDPTIAIPTFMLGQSPDVNYHTDKDTIDKLDPFILQKSACIAASYAYALANLSIDDLSGILNKSGERLSRALSLAIERAHEKKDKNDNQTANDLYEEFEQIKRFAGAGCDDYKRFFKGSEQERLSLLIGNEQQYIKTIVDAAFKKYLVNSGVKDFTYRKHQTPSQYAGIPIRKHVSPIQHLDDYAINDNELYAAYTAYNKGSRKKFKSSGDSEALIQFYMDGKRSIFEIARELRLELNDGDPDIVMDYIKLLEQYKLVDIIVEVK